MIMCAVTLEKEDGYGVLRVPVFLNISGSFSGLIANTGTLAKTVLGVLLVLSVVSWTIIFEKIRFFRRSGKHSAGFRSGFGEKRSLKALAESKG